MGEVAVSFDIVVFRERAVLVRGVLPGVERAILDLLEGEIL